MDVFESFDDVAKVTYAKESIERWKRNPSILSGGDARSLMFQQRYYTILQQLFRDSKFMDTARGKRGADFPMISFGSRAVEDGDNKSVNANIQSLFLIHEIDVKENETWRFEISPVESLPGSVGIKVVFGMLSRGEDGRICIEDIHQSVPIKLDAVQSTNDYITEDIFVLLKGEMIDDYFVAYQMTLPPVPRRSLCEASINLFGGPIELTDEIVLSAVGHSPEDSSIAILSNVALDNPKTLEKLHVLLTGFEECEAVPSMFVLSGNFSSRPFSYSNGEGLRAFQKSFEAFSQLLGRHPATLDKTKIVIVPGSTDPGAGILPQPPFTDSLVRGLASRFSNVVLATNPCRIRFHDKHIIINNRDIVHTLRKYSLVAATSNNFEDEGLKLSRCLMSQMHLMPGPVQEQPVAWDFDAGLKVYPPPNALFLFDSLTDPFVKDLYGETIVVGMPRFSSADDAEAEFHLYSPYSNESTLSSV